MGRRLAIKGHPTRGNEVIELLEMMGGYKDSLLKDEDIYDDNYFYFIFAEENNAIDGYPLKYKDKVDEDYIIFTLEEFLEKYPFKVGDKVRDGHGDALTIKAMSWFVDCETMAYTFEESVIVLAAEDLLMYNNLIHKRTHEDVIFDSIIWHLRNSVNNGKQNLSGGECEEYFREVVKKNNENKMKNVLAELLEHIKTTPKEELEKEFNELEEWSHVGPTVEEFMTFCECVNKKPKYLETYIECCDVLNLAWNKCFVMFDIDYNGLTDEENNLYESLIKLKRCRDAYWKIAGEEMGLDEPWEPDWNDQKPKYTITVIGNQLIKHHSLSQNYILAFPTTEMRDVFYENFKDLIKSCKELL